LNWENLRVGCLEEFINARTPLSAADLRDPEISELIGKKLREFHDLMDPRTSRCGRGSGGGLSRLVSGVPRKSPNNFS